MAGPHDKPQPRYLFRRLVCGSSSRSRGDRHHNQVRLPRQPELRRSRHVAGRAWPLGSAFVTWGLLGGVEVSETIRCAGFRLFAL
jgi:hypothetical protein